MESLENNNLWSLYSSETNNFLKPIEFSNKKTQKSVVKEILENIKKGEKIIFLKGLCGTGKSAIALNVAKEIGKASIVVPIKNLQKQYEIDYTNKKYLLKNNQKLKIVSITGRQNHKCPFIQEGELDSYLDFSSEKKEKNSTLDIFDNSKKIIENYENNSDISCDNELLPCKIDIKNRNRSLIKNYLKNNSALKNKSLSLEQTKRLSIAPVCPYWSPVIPSEIDLTNILEDATLIDYSGLNNNKYTIYQRKKGCPYYNQFLAYNNSDVIIFNSYKYKIEFIMGRKPETNIEIIDECDEFLDSFANTEKIDLKKLENAITYILPGDYSAEQTINEILKLIKKLKNNSAIDKFIEENKILTLKETEIYKLLRLFLDTSLLDYVECDEENYSFHIEKIGKTFKTSFSDTYVNFYKKEDSLIAELVTINLEKKFQELTEKNKVLLLMSGTLHSKEVLEKLFGISNFSLIEAETNFPGQIIPIKTGFEINCNYSNLKNPLTRKTYLRALNKCVEKAKIPCIIHVTSFYDLPSEQEKEEMNLNLMSREKLKELQINDKESSLIENFKQGKFSHLYTTRCSRGVDFPGEKCNSIILTKFPYPNVKSIFWKILRQTKPQYYDYFYKDKSKREFLQKIYRALRFKEDKVQLLSPDSRVFYNLSELNKN